MHETGMLIVFLSFSFLDVTSNDIQLGPIDWILIFLVGYYFWDGVILEKTWHTLASIIKMKTCSDMKKVKKERKIGKGNTQRNKQTITETKKERKIDRNKVRARINK